VKRVHVLCKLYWAFPSLGLVKGKTAVWLGSDHSQGLKRLARPRMGEKTFGQMV